MKPAIRIEGLSKLYHLGRQRDPHQTLRETLTQAFQDRWNGVAALFRNDDEAAGDDGPTTLWALKSVTFDIQPGEVVGIIGRNGAGKSTLLKIISRITEPTSGRIRLRGRVRSLLEVGTGFHPELTGRENIFLNGAILGMSRAEIVSKFDEIVAFSEIEKFLDTPVKRYSSGMYVRLAFGVAAHLEPEILIVDEVLAVGDAQFQRKCLGKMEEVATRGRTVLFVSHQLDAVQRLCNQVAYLERGHLKGYGPTRQIVAQYLAHGPQNVQPGRWLKVPTTGTESLHPARFIAVQYSSEFAPASGHPYCDGPLNVTLAIECKGARTVNSLSVMFFDRSGTKLVNADTLTLGKPVSLIDGRNEVKVRIGQLHLKPGVYNLALAMAENGQVLHNVPPTFPVEVVDLTMSSLGKRPEADGAVTCSFELVPTG